MSKLKHIWPLLILLTLPATAATVSGDGQGPPEGECLVVSYVSFGNRSVHTLVLNNSTVFGDYLTIKTGCDGPFNVSLNDVWVGEFTNSTRLMLHETLAYLRVEGHGWFVEYSGVIHASEADFQAYDRIFREVEYPHYLSISPDDLEWRQTKVAFFTGIIVWFFVQYILWIFINNYVDRFHCSEVS